MGYYYSGQVRRQFVTQAARKNLATKRLNRRESINSTLIFTVLTTLLAVAGWIDKGGF